jgi:hypothetical protein
VSSRKRARLFSEVNDRIYELLASAETDLPGEFLCECGRDCEQRVPLIPPAFAALRRASEPVLSTDCRPCTESLRGREAQFADSIPAAG